MCQYCESIQTNNCTLYLDNCISIFSLIVAIAAMITAWYTAYKNNKVSQGSLILKLKTLELDNKRRLQKAIIEIENLRAWIENQGLNLKFSTFSEELSKDEYENIREMLYFYEYLGSIVKMKQISFNQVFSIIYFPDDIDTKAQNIIPKIQEQKHDFMENYQYLRSKYQNKRLKNHDLH